ncbi:MAG: GGDEF domain-containing protein [Christensenellales bacterium]|jgi:diguanylate cyclase (GGDEF)-like protein
MEPGARLIELYKKRHYDMLSRYFRRGLLAAGGICCAVGIVITAVTGQTAPMFLYIAALVCIALVLPLMHAGLISNDMACIIPALFFCFIYTPVNWFAFNGLLGFTPYLSLIIILGIVLLNLRKWQNALLGSYIVLLLALMVCDLVRFVQSENSVLLINAAAGYTVALGVVTIFLLLLMRRQERMTHEVLGGCVTDELTGMLCRRAIKPVADLVEETYNIEKHDYTVLVMDVDKLKKLNAERGRAFGDGVLRDIATCIRSNIRSTDFAFRSGDDEFLIVLTDADPDSADAVIERLDKAVRDTLDGTRATVSRCSVRRSECGGPAQVIELAERRLAQSKCDKKKSVKGI